MTRPEQHPASNSESRKRSIPPPPPRPTPLPDPGVTENGKVRCNEPYLVDGVVVGYCERWVKARHRGREKGTHRGGHCLEWWT